MRQPEKVAVYTVVITRLIGDEDGQSHLGVRSPEDAVQQLRMELQDGWDEAGIAGSFQIIAREEPDMARPYDLAGILANASSKYPPSLNPSHHHHV